MPTRSNPAAMVELRTAADRRADRRALWISVLRVVAVLSFLALTFAAAFAVLKLEVQGMARMALVWGPVCVSAVAGGVIAWTVRKLDERERAVALSGLLYAALGLAGMMMGAAAQHMTDPEPGTGVAALAFMALPLLLSWWLITPLIVRLLRKPGC